MNNKLQVILDEQGIDKSDVAKLVKAFGGPFEEAGIILDTYKEIEVTAEDDAEGMAKAREQRLVLKKARTTIENKRKELKADIIKQGRAIDSVAKLVKEEIEPAEKYLETQEKFAELAAAKRAAELKAERIEKLMQYTDDVSVYSLDNMTVEQFDNLFNSLKSQYEAEQKRIADEKKQAEEARIAEEKRIAEQAKENERLRAEAKAREEAEAKAEAERKAEQAKKDAEIQAEQDRIRKEAEAKIAKEREAKEALEAEKRQREAEAARVKAEAEEAERQALLAPDKEKLVNFANAIEVIRTSKLPAVKSNEAQKIVNQIDEKLELLKKQIIEASKRI